ncbi:hypothetical protein PV11_02845 [Exophiala sideris]|uniref:Uncharacterized protein n=1 Tax=Exophiala sideris TaxID=1016849 RepID=A0A0D1WEN7_9EURO|nr:hypothetical protein PV11_02845 [Exophiala sideris]
MDPFSITVGAIGVAEVSQKTAKSVLKILRTIKKAPEELEQLLEEVTKVETTLEEVKDAVQAAQHSSRALDVLLHSVELDLSRLNNLIQFELVKPGEKVEARRLAWVRHRSRVNELTTKLQTKRREIADILFTAVFSQSRRTSIQVQQLTLISTEGLSKAEQALDQVMHNRALLEDMCERIERTHTATTQIGAAFEGFRTVHVEPNNALSRAETPASLREQTMNMSAFPGQQPLRRYNSAIPYRGLYIKTLKSNANGCAKSCPCACHKRRRISHSARQWTGSLNVTFSGVSMLSPQCSIRTCKRTLRPWFQVSYALPIWLANRLLVMSLTSSPVDGPELLLKTARYAETAVPMFVEKGMLSNVRSLYVAGAASVRDMQWDGGTLLTAVSWAQWDMANFLLDSGADMNQETTDGRTPRTRFLELWFLPTTVKDEAADRLHHHLDIREMIDEREFCSVHRIVLGLSKQDLETELMEHPELINTPDVLGKTPLWWACNCFNVEAVRLLLYHGARVDDADLRKHTPLHMASIRGASKALVSSLLMARANVNSKNLSGMTPLHHASRKGVPEIVETLVNFGADVNAVDRDNHTPLYHCAYKETEECAQILLNHGADLDICDNKGLFVWEHAIMSGSVRTIKLFSKYGCRFQIVPGTKAHPAILHYVARFGTEALVEALMYVDLSHVQVEAQDEEGRTAEESLRLRCSPQKPPGWFGCTQEVHDIIQEFLGRLNTTQLDCL